MYLKKTHESFTFATQPSWSSVVAKERNKTT